jgi:hypothetical protein
MAINGARHSTPKRFFWPDALMKVPAIHAAAISGWTQELSFQ